ncbi:MAG: hypothetical protein IKM28_10410 [Lachnospiraceae bacterium]|nr:hypothetical protein [Lachnospiraceae bacterium]
MNIFCLNGYNGEKLSLELNEVIGFPNNTSIEGGYDIICTLVIDSGCYHIEFDRLYSATGTLYRFSKELDACYTVLFGSAEYHSLYENGLVFNVEMTSGGLAIVTGTFQERPDKQNVLQFEFDTDQSCLLSVIQDIESLKVKYGGMEGLHDK